MRGDGSGQAAKSMPPGAARRRRDAGAFRPATRRFSSDCDANRFRRTARARRDGDSDTKNRWHRSCIEGGSISARMPRPVGPAARSDQSEMKMSVVAVVGLGYVGLPLAVEFGKRFRTIGFDLSQKKIDSYRRFVDPTGECSTENLKAATLLEVTTDATKLADADFVDRRGADAGRRGAPARLHAARRRERGGRREPQEGRDRRLRVDGLSRRDRGGLHPDPRGEVGPDVEAGFPRRLLARAHQPGRQGAHADEDHRRSSPATTPTRSKKVADLYGAIITAGVYPASQHQGRRGREGHREHAARPQHRADERARDHLRQDRHRHDRGAARPPARSGTSCRSGRASSAATASASIRTT